MSELTSMQRIFGEHLEKLGNRHKNLVVLDSDLNNSLQTLKFARAFPERHFSTPMTQSTMLNMTTGMLVRGKLPVCCAKSLCLWGKGYETIRNSLSYNNLNLKLIGSNSGLCNNANSAHEHSIEDIALARLIPELKILSPADHNELRSMMDLCAEEFGLFYLRLTAAPQQQIYDQNYKFELGKANIVKSGEQICIFSTGTGVNLSLQAASELEKRGATVQVVNMSSIEPLDTAIIEKCAANFNLIVSVEEHHLSGGLGDAILNHLNKTNPKKLLKIGIEGTPQAGSYQIALEKNRLNPKGIYEQIKEVWLNL